VVEVVEVGRGGGGGGGGGSGAAALLVPRNSDSSTSCTTVPPYPHMTVCPCEHTTARARCPSDRRFSLSR
jgi:hypothetical protein